jgi:phosphatidylglycerol---prolipoprotein diacylglyceryl transferase
MAVFLGFYLKARINRSLWATTHAFHAMIIVYAGERFAWEFLKPYPTVLGPFNVFHLLMLGLVAYGVVWWQRGDANHAVSSA